ncbi:uncharacterized protein LOC122251073 [Penaeus japonicus]|uniref:uncharacterized protein LOC122251073 n=1 Tax=Penaeus japonicus TaxID=27405 RepID=UPI001C70F86A|nr:uncharacterized protein LOC122251073 [Penaeus japonicus]
MVECGDDHRWNVTGPELECAIICVDDPVIPPTPATLSWDGQNRTYGTEALLECPNGLRFADESTNMSLTCMENGTWTQPDAELLVCRIRADEPPKNLTDATLSGPDPPYWKDMVLNLTCNDGWLTTSGEKQTTVTFNGSTWLLDDPDFECWKVADDPPEVISNATLGGPDPPYWKTVTLNYTCDDGFLTSLGARQTLVTFNGTAWEMDDPEFACWKVATKPPENITGASLEGPDPPYWKTTTLNYTCFNGFLTADGEDQTSVTFNGTDWVLDDPDFVCLMVCPPPPAPLAYVRRNYTGKGIDGDVATYVCAGAFDNGNDTVDITCTAGNWSMDVLPECGKEGERSSRSCWYFLRIFPSVEYRGSCAFRVHLDIFLLIIY